MISAEAIS